jgi:hypothetical protein
LNTILVSNGLLKTVTVSLLDYKIKKSNWVFFFLPSTMISNLTLVVVSVVLGLGHCLVFCYKVKIGTINKHHSTFFYMESTLYISDKKIKKMISSIYPSIHNNLIKFHRHHHLYHLSSIYISGVPLYSWIRCFTFCQK